MFAATSRLASLAHKELYITHSHRLALETAAIVAASTVAHSDNQVFLRKVTLYHNNTTARPRSSMDIPNPITPLVFLPPEIANQYQISCYLYIATAGVSCISCAQHATNLKIF